MSETVLRRSSDGLLPRKPQSDGWKLQGEVLNQSDISTPIMFHPVHENKWQVSMKLGAIELQAEKPLNPDILEQAIDAAQRLVTMSKESSEDATFLRRNAKFKAKKLLLSGQVLSGSALGKYWIETSRGYLPRVFSVDEMTDFAAKPFWPSYRVVDKTHAASKGVAPYLVESSYEVASGTNNVPDEVPKFKEYDPNSPYRVESLTRVIGYIFENEETPVPGLDAKISNWWTSDGRTWWPKKVTRTHQFGIPLPKKMCCFNVPGKSVTIPTVKMFPTYIKVGFQGRGYMLTGVILAEYVMIVVGAIAGLAYGWSVSLQLIYFSILVLLSLVEVVFVATMVPNGQTWLRLNCTKCALAVATSSLWRWDLYGDVGFAVLAYKQRHRLTLPLWIGSTIVSALVIGGRLLYSFYYMSILLVRVDERNLAQVSIPAFMNVIRDLCRTIESDEGTEARRLSVTSELWFEILRVVCEDLPEIIIQGLYLFGDDAPPGCSACAYGFVFTSFVVSVLTTGVGCNRILVAFKRYNQVVEEIACRTSEREETAGFGKNKSTEVKSNLNQ